MPSNEEPVAWIQAWKPVDGPGHCISPCSADDEDATEFRVHYRGMQFSSSSIDFRADDYPGGRKTAKFRAEGVMHAISRAHSAGRAAYAKDLRRFMGVKE